MRNKNNSFVFPTLAGAVIVMTIAGMMDMHFGDIILAGLVGALAMQLWRLRQTVEDLSDQVDDLELQVQARQPTDVTQRDPAPQTAPQYATRPIATHTSQDSAASSTGSSKYDAPPPEQPKYVSPADTPTIIRPAATSSTTTSASAPARPVYRYTPPPPSAIELQATAFWNWLKSRNPIALAAVAISFLGAVFLVKYAAEHSHFPVEYRFIALSLVTIGSVIIGWRIHANKPEQRIFAQVIQGGGVAGLYLTVFAATRLYQLLPPQLAFVLLASVAFAAAILAVTQGALPLAIIGTVGGFLTPILVSTGGGSHIALFTYYALLNVGVFTVAWFRTWRVLNVLSFAFTFSITALWRGHSYHQADWWSADLFLLLFFLMFAGISILNALRQSPNLKGYVSGSLVFGLPVAAFSLHASLVQDFPYALAYSALGMGIFYCVIALALRRSANANFKILIEAFAALAVIFSSLAIPLAFNRHVTAAMWSFEGAGMIWLGLRTQRKLPRFFGVLLQVSAGVSYLHAIALPAADSVIMTPIINGVYLGSVLLCSTAWFSAWLLHNHQRNHIDQPLAKYETSWALIALWAGCAWWLFGGLNEIDTRLDTMRMVTALIHGSVGAGILYFAALRWPWRTPAIIALFAPTSGSFIALWWLGWINHEPHPFANWGFLGWPIVFATEYTLLWLSDTRATAETRSESLNPILHTGTYLALTLILTWEAHWQCSSRIAGVWPTLITALIPALMLWPLLSRTYVRWPMSLHARSYRVHAGMALAAFVQLWLLIVNTSNAGDPGFITYIPLFNPLDITSLLLFGIVIKWWQALNNTERQQCWPLQFSPMIVIAALLFVWMNAALIRTLHYYFDVSLEFNSLFESTLVQTTLSIFWMLLSLIAMLYASRRLKRSLWITGAVLMSVVIGKLLLIDLVHTGTLARIVSFLSVGGLLFVVSYMSPLPPASESETSAE